MAENLSKIKEEFSALVQQVESALESKQISVDIVHSFLVRYFSRDDWIQCPTSFKELFNALSVSKLWNHDHYSPLESIIRQYLADDANVKAAMLKYKGQLTGFYAMRKFADFVKLSDFEDSEQEPQQSLSLDTYTSQDYRKLKLKLNLGNRKVSSLTLKYVDEVWRSLAEQFDLPSLTAVIHSIVEGCLEITWLILPHFAEKIVDKSTSAVKFFRSHKIVHVAIDDFIVYDEEQMVSSKLTVWCLCTHS